MQKGVASAGLIDRALDYGDDAPEITRMIFLIGSPPIAAGIALTVFAGVTWATWLGVLFLVLAFAPLTLGIMMRLYAWRRKLRPRDRVLARHDGRGMRPSWTPRLGGA